MGNYSNNKPIGRHAVLTKDGMVKRMTLKDFEVSRYSKPISMFKLNEDAFNKQYKSNDIVLLKDINGLELESINDKQKQDNIIVKFNSEIDLEKFQESFKKAKNEL